MTLIHLKKYIMEVYYYNHCEFKDLPWISDRAKELADMVRNSDRADFIWSIIEEEVLSSIREQCLTFTICDPVDETEYFSLKQLEEFFIETCAKHNIS